MLNWTPKTKIIVEKLCSYLTKYSEIEVFSSLLSNEIENTKKALADKYPDIKINFQNIEFNELKDDHSLNMPSLFVHASYDYVCDTTSSPKFAQPMRELCKNLTEERIDCGHWMAQEKPEELNKILEKWLKSI